MGTSGQSDTLEADLVRFFGCLYDTVMCGVWTAAGPTYESSSVRFRFFRVVESSSGVSLAMTVALVLCDSVAAAASAAVASMISFKLSSKAASRLFIVLRLLNGFSIWVGERDRDSLDAVLCE